MRSVIRSRTLSAGALFLAVAGVIAPASAAPRALQTTQGSVAAPMRFPQDATYSTWVKPQRDIYRTTDQNGQLGYAFEIDRRTWGGAFRLDVLDGATGQEDIDITFYSDMAAPTSPGASDARGAGGEVGIVPASSTHAIVTLFYGADASFVYKAFAAVPKKAAKVSLPAAPKPGVHAGYGKNVTHPIATTLKKRSQVVIAVIDTGINPYHVSYRRPELVVHPSTYIEGFPKDAPALGLTLNQKDYAKARNADDAPVWSKVQERKLYWIPGTNIIGAYSQYDYYDETPEIGDPEIKGVKNMGRPVIDDSGHGTGTTSVSGGGIYGSNPDALIVSVEGFGTDAVKWAASQPWIDFISGSYGDPTATPYTKEVPKLPTLQNPVGETDSREYEHTGPFVLRDGRTACFSAGNGLSRTGAAYDRYSSIRPTSGPSWIVTVGAASPRNDQNYGWHSIPVDISSYGLHWPAADYASTDGSIDFGGTSNATPVTCGVFSKALLEARKALGDTREGIHSVGGQRVPAAGRRGPGLLSDGILTRIELQDAVFKTAQHAPFDPQTFAYEPVSTIPDSPAYYTQEGYGIANMASGKRAVDVIFGRSPMPDRAEVDQWIATIDIIRDALWNPDDYKS